MSFYLYRSMRKICVYKTSAVFTDEVILEQMKAEPHMKSQLAIMDKFEIIRNNGFASVNFLIEDKKKND